MMNGGQDFASTLSQRDKFLSRHHKRYNSSKQAGGEASFRVLYYGAGAGSVPFLWESQPGTPKHKLSDGPLPPLTPPPQFHSSPLASPGSKKKHRRKIFNIVLATTPWRKSSAPTSPRKPSPSKESERAGLCSVHFDVEEDEYDEAGRDSPTSTLCFRGGRTNSVKKVVKCIAGPRNF
ncbi:hypothetical protein SASPL_123462 [Salvia splendens]|uniref:Uncharacterized protein n=1 Tax=Salvia splendens TaxID=180675 RepID=A0A8X8XKF2_SALSN|nr:uncharacterized protein LOC121745842 [Salvia splendens]KAG6416040.1 hypothetical protein SASPL_123462 [Salvia splendens]